MANPGSETDELTAWALRARDGDPVAQAAFVRQSQAEVWRLCAALASPGDADDLTQDTYLRAFRALPEFAARSSARTWLLSIARRACADHVRAAVRRRRLDAVLRLGRAEAAPDPAEATEAADLLDKLPEGRRAAFVLTQVLGLSYEEAAAVEGVPLGTVRSRVARARADLVELMAAALAS